MGHPCKDFGADYKPRIFKNANIKNRQIQGMPVKSSRGLRIGFALSKSPHLHRGYLVTVCKRMFMNVCIHMKNCNYILNSDYLAILFNVVTDWKFP